MSVLMETSFGDIVFDLFLEEAPLACKNFLKLCKIKYYNNCEFFYVDKGFIIQTGDPSNEGKGGTSVYGMSYGPQANLFDDEISPHLRHTRPGIVSMANSGENKNGSQFFITTGYDMDSLDEKHTIFAVVAEGMDTVTAIDSAFTNEQKRPYQIIRIRHTYILHDPFPDPSGMPEVPPSSPLPEIVDDPSRIAEDEVVDEAYDEERLAELEEEQKAKEARSRAEVLEIIGDIKSADMKPPENVLFVARLNPVTQAEDLEIIFSRFGECKVDIIRDKSTGDSLCYGFIEFEDVKSCERAYFKMDNTLVDDRRIKVDFSQSVSKLWNNVRRGKRVKMSKQDYDFEERKSGMDRSQPRMDPNDKTLHRPEKDRKRGRHEYGRRERSPNRGRGRQELERRREGYGERDYRRQRDRPRGYGVDRDTRRDARLDERDRHHHQDRRRDSEDRRRDKGRYRRQERD